jgi:hypothetical protein
MPVRFIIRPSDIRRTPRELASRFAVETRRYPSRIRTVFDYRRDLFLIYPPPQSVYNRPSRGANGQFQSVYPYERLYSFFSSNKAAQRQTLKLNGIPVPETYTDRYEAAYAIGGTWIVRPLRHSGGQGYRITTNATDFQHGEYLSRVFPKDHEYRIIFVLGEPLITLYKRVPEGLSPQLPWNHANGSTFVTVNDIRKCRLSRTNIYDVLRSLPIIKYGHIIAADILWSNGNGYVICELNTCPGLTIDNNLERVASYVETHHGLL